MNLKVTFSESNDVSLSVVFSELDKSLGTGFGEVQIVNTSALPKYDGDYVVTPKVTEQMMPTKDKVMRDDVTVRAIPYFDVSNPAGGKTIYIANEV